MELKLRGFHVIINLHFYVKLTIFVNAIIIKKITTYNIKHLEIKQVTVYIF